jgi:hypothetical protein
VPVCASSNSSRRISATRTRGGPRPAPRRNFWPGAPPVFPEVLLDLNRPAQAGA